MIEIPEAVNLAKQLNRTIKGKKISSVVAAEHPHKFAWYFEDPSAYEKILKGKTIEEAVTEGSFVEIRAGNAKILYTEGINLRFIEDPKKLPKKHQLLIQFEDETVLCASIQMYGGLIVFKDDEYENEYYTVAKEKPSPLSDEFDKGYFFELCKIAETKKNISLKALLATEQRIPGFGNGCLQDVLYNAKLHPKTKFNELTLDDKTILYNCIKQTLLEMAQKGGRDTEKDLFGEQCGYKTKLSKHTVNRQCNNCGSMIMKAAYMGGSIYFCPECQDI
jgi:formamidopyrimidine-DNA glycosylase